MNTLQPGDQAPKKALSTGTIVIAGLLIGAVIIIFIFLQMASSLKPPSVEGNRVDITTVLSTQSRAWPSREIAGVSVELPGIPQLDSAPTPKAAQGISKVREIYILNSNGIEFTLGHFQKTSGAYNLDNMQAANGIKNLPGASDISSTDNYLFIDGARAKRFIVQFKLNGREMSLYNLVFVRNDEMWNLTVSGSPSGSSEFAERAFGSVHLIR